MYNNVGTMQMLAIRLPEEIEKRLERLAEETGRTKTFYAREAILEHIEDLEDTYLSASRLKRTAKHWTQEELERVLDLDG
jgi:RHH-type rel operon transcriptional repressor/antitoxin RelB